MKRPKISYEFAIPFLIIGVLTILHVTGILDRGENRVFDLLLRFRPAPAEHQDLVMVDFDDTAINEIGTWPVPRNIVADGLLLMREMGAKYAIFDIEYIDDSPRGVNTKVLNNTIPQVVSEEIGSIQNNVQQLFSAIQSGAIPVEAASQYVQDLYGLTEQSQEQILNSIDQIVRDNDVYFGKAARFFGNSYFTVNMQKESDPTVPQELKDYFTQEIAVENIDVNGGIIPEAQEIRPTITPIIQGAAGAGFPNVVIDEDGVRRSIYLLYKYKDSYFAQLAFSPLLRMLDYPEIVQTHDNIILKDARIPGKQPHDITIPLLEDYQFLINWPHETYFESFRHMSFYELMLHDELYELLIYNLRTRADWGYLDAYGGDIPLMEFYNHVQQAKDKAFETGDQHEVDNFIELNGQFLSEVGTFLNSDVENLLMEQVTGILSDEELPDSLRQDYEMLAEDIPTFFKNTREIHNDLEKSRTRLKEALTNGFCILGWTGTGTTDIGVNPFDNEYVNVGTHASMVNTILQEDFLDRYPWYFSMAIGLITSLILISIIRRRTTLFMILGGIAFLLIVIAILSGFFIVTGNFIPLLTPSLAVLFSFLTLVFIVFFNTEKEKGYIRDAFAHYLSNEVINELLNDPDKLNLGGEKKYISAMFTDIKGFSTISEQLDPRDLVSLLNKYLTEMTNVVLTQQGTIDKYEGDAIICFFGAPLEYSDHAERACYSAVKMKSLEQEMNKYIVHDGLSPAPLNTRIGINTGDMVVGNMGSELKMDYTMMGNAVNLAARLEGVNKQYGTWVLITEMTKNELNTDYVTRRLDQVRVVGIKQPVRLYELVDKKEFLPQSKMETLHMFEEGLQVFEAREWEKAEHLFKEILDKDPEDGPAQVYLKRCQDFLKQPPSDKWDGVFSLTSK